MSISEHLYTSCATFDIVATYTIFELGKLHIPFRITQCDRNTIQPKHLKSNRKERKLLADLIDLCLRGDIHAGAWRIIFAASVSPLKFNTLVCLNVVSMNCFSEKKLFDWFSAYIVTWYLLRTYVCSFIGTWFETDK